MRCLAIGVIVFLVGAIVLIWAMLCNPYANIKDERGYRIWRLIGGFVISCCSVGALFALISFFVVGKLSSIICFAAMVLAIPFAMRIVDGI